MLHYLRIWLSTARYSIVRMMMFRFDFFLWSAVELFWMGVNVLMISVIYEHTSSIAGWDKYDMLLLVGTSMLIQRFLMGFFWSSLFEMSRNIRTGHFDFFLAQPGNVQFMASTRKLDPDSLANSIIAVGVVLYAAHMKHLHPSAADIALYAVMIVCGVIIHYSILLLSMSLGFWITNATGIEGSYFSLTEFSRLPREAFKSFASLFFVWIIPVVVVSNAPARTLIHGFEPRWVIALLAAAIFWFSTATFVFHRGLRRYSSASS